MPAPSRTSPPSTPTPVGTWSSPPSPCSPFPRRNAAPLLRWLAQSTRALAVVEFDVAHVSDPFTPHWFRRCLERLERGLREYDNERDLVGAGFILPVILGHFATHTRTNHEHSIQDWVQDLERAGFTDVGAHRLCDYWWEPAWLIQARGQRTV